MDLIHALFDAQLTIGDQHLLWREIVGNGFGLASALGGMRRKECAWPVARVGKPQHQTASLGAA